MDIRNGMYYDPVTERWVRPVMQVGDVTYGDAPITVGSESTPVLQANPNRKYALLVNDSDVVIYLRIGDDAHLNRGIRLNANGGSYEMSANIGNLDLRAINAIASSSNKNLLVTEGQ